MLEVEIWLSELRGLEREFADIGVGVELADGDEALPVLDFGCEVGGGLAYEDCEFEFYVWSIGVDRPYTTCDLKEFRHELARRLAGQYERDAKEAYDLWRELDDTTPMFQSLADDAAREKELAGRLHALIKDDGVPVLLDRQDFNTLACHRRPLPVSSGPTNEHLRSLGLMERRTQDGQEVDVITDEGRRALKYTARTSERTKPCKEW